MKRLTILALLLLTLSYWLVADYRFGQTKPLLGATLNRAHPLARGLVEYWPMNEGGGTVIYGLVHGIKGNFYADPSWVTTERGLAVDLDGVNNDDDKIQIESAEVLKLTGAMSVSAWVYDRGTSGDKYNRYVTKFGSTSDHGWELTRQSSDDIIHFYIAQTASSGHDVASSDTGPSDYVNQWVHWVGVYEPSTALRLYKNGVLKNSNVSSIPASQRNSTVPVEFGRYIGNTHYNGHLNGQLCDVRIYNRALSPSEVAWLYRDPYADILSPLNISQYYVAPGGAPTPARRTIISWLPRLPTVPMPLEVNE